jgi:Tfp pilus assembly protein PilV
MAKLSSQGLSLVGVLIALFVLATTAVALGRLLTNRAEVVGRSRSTLAAVSLAREGLELARAVRDTNWLQKNARWTHGLCDVGTHVMIDPAGVRDASSARTVDQAGQLFRADSGELTHARHDTSSLFRRTLSLDCSQENNADLAYITVTATVTWNQEGTDRTVELKEQLFNWLPPL